LRLDDLAVDLAFEFALIKLDVVTAPDLESGQLIRPYPELFPGLGFDLGELLAVLLLWKRLR
jgi:hypothetical protein